MPFEISPELEKRLCRIAEQKNCTVEILLADYADKTEASLSGTQPESLHFGLFSNETRRILNAIFDGYLLGDMAGNILDVNAAYCQMLGYTREELLQLTVLDLDAEMPAEVLIGNAQRIHSNDISLMVETKQYHKDGHTIDLEINSIRIQESRIACFIRDISERKQIENRMHRYEQEYRGLIESNIDLVSRYLPDTTLTFVNRAYCEYFGVSAKDLIGKSITQFADAEGAVVIKKHIQDILKNPAPAMLTLQGKNMRGEETWVQWVYYGIMDTAGTVVEIQSVGRDVTQLMQTQQALAQQQEMMSTILENIPLMLVQIDQNRNYKYVNKHWVDKLGWTLEEIQTYPTNIMEEFYPDPVYREHVIQVISSGKPEWVDHKTRIRDGSILDTSWFNVLLSDGSGIGIGQDITQRLELEQQRIYAEKLEIEIQKERELQELKDRFVSIVSHEFRIPLSVIATSISLVTGYFDRLPREKIITKLDDVQLQVKRMIHLMEEVLRFSKNEAGKTEFIPETVQVAIFCQKIVETLTVIDTNQHTINHTVDSGTIVADTYLLDHILTNLLSNALKYSPIGTTIHFEVTKLEGVWQFKVADNGIGIPENDLRQIFEPFHRGSNAYKLPGTGLGLSIVKDYVAMHKGTIEVDSIVGVGTTFMVTLPDS